MGYVKERAYVMERWQTKVEPCHVAHVKAALGLTRGVAPNRIDVSSRVKPCPPHLWHMVEEAVRHVHADRL